MRRVEGREKLLTPSAGCQQDDALPQQEASTFHVGTLVALDLNREKQDLLYTIGDQFCGTRMFIPDPRSDFFHPGSRVDKIPDPHKTP